MTTEELLIKRLLYMQLQRLITITATVTVKAQSRPGSIDTLFEDPDLVRSIDDITDNFLFIIRNTAERKDETLSI